MARTRPSFSWSSIAFSTLWVFWRKAHLRFRAAEALLTLYLAAAEEAFLVTFLAPAAAFFLEASISIPYCLAKKFLKGAASTETSTASARR